MRASLLLKTAPVLAALLLGGCLSLGGKVPETLFTLTAETPLAAGTAISGKPAEAIVVFEPETDRRLGVQRVAVQIDPTNVAYLQNAMWVERPARLFQTLLAETIRSKSGKLVLLADDNPGTGAIRLNGRLIDMGYDAPGLRAVVRFDAIRTDGTGTVATKRFESVVSGVAADAVQVAPALNQAANEVSQQVAEWLAVSSAPAVQTPVQP